jgi:hypothetical protein
MRTFASRTTSSDRLCPSAKPLRGTDSAPGLRGMHASPRRAHRHYSRQGQAASHHKLVATSPGATKSASECVRNPHFRLFGAKAVPSCVSDYKGLQFHSRGSASRSCADEWHEHRAGGRIIERLLSHGATSAQGSVSQNQHSPAKPTGCAACTALGAARGVCNCIL